jgi:hypothetical protein
MGWLRRVARWIALVLLLGLATAVFTSVLAEFFVEWAKEEGWYDRPTAKVKAALDALLPYMPWALLSLAFLSGLTLGLWVDRLLGKPTGPFAAISRKDDEELAEFIEQTATEMIEEGAAARLKDEETHWSLAEQVNDDNRNRILYDARVERARYDERIERKFSPKIARILAELARRGIETKDIKRLYHTPTLFSYPGLILMEVAGFVRRREYLHGLFRLEDKPPD